MSDSHDANEGGNRAGQSASPTGLRTENSSKLISQAHPVSDFLLLAEHGLKTAIRHERPFSVLDVVLARTKDVSGDEDMDVTSDAFATLSKIVIEKLRACDLVTTSANRIVVGLPETKAAKASVILWRFKEEFRQSIKAQLTLECKVAQDKKALQLLEVLGSRLIQIQ